MKIYYVYRPITKIIYPFGLILPNDPADIAITQTPLSTNFPTLQLIEMRKIVLRTIVGRAMLKTLEMNRSSLRPKRLRTPGGSRAISGLRPS